MVAEVNTDDRMSPLTVPSSIFSFGEGVMTMGQLEGGSSHSSNSNNKMPALVSPPASPTTTKVQVTPGVARKKRAYRKKNPSTNTAKRQLAADFQPSSYSVICGRGKECFDSEGNKRFRQIINKFLDDYAAAPGKSEKSVIVSKAMNIIREASPQGAFVKCEKGIWFEVSTRYAREKVGAWFRDCLHCKYKSSSKAKHARKMAKRVSFNALDPEDIMNFSLDVEFELPELDDKFYDDMDQDSHNESLSAGDSAKSVSDDSATSDCASPISISVTEDAEGIKVGGTPMEKASVGPQDPPAHNEVQVCMDPPGNLADTLKEARESNSGSFYDIDDISLTLVPFDAVDDDL